MRSQIVTVAPQAWHRRGNISSPPQKSNTPDGVFYFCARNASGVEPGKRVRTAAKRWNNAGRRRRFCKVGASQYFVSASIIPLRRRGVFMRRIKTGRVFARLNLKIAFYRILWYNRNTNRAALCRLFLSPRLRDFMFMAVGNLVLMVVLT